MTRDEFKILVKGLKAVYTQPSFIPDKDAFEVWYGLLEDLDYKTCSNAIKKHMLTVEKEPTPASIRKQIVSLQTDKDELNEMEAWQMVLNAMRNSIYHSEEEFAKLPSLVQKAVVSPGQLREWAMAEDIDGTWMNVTQSNFMRTYRAVTVRDKEKQKLSPDILKLMGNEEKKKIAQPVGMALMVAEERELEGKRATKLSGNLRVAYDNLRRALGG